MDIKSIVSVIYVFFVITSLASFQVRASEIIADGLDLDRKDLFFDNGYVYFGDYIGNDGRLVRVPEDGGDIQVLATGTSFFLNGSRRGIQHIDFTSNYIYFGFGGYDHTQIEELSRNDLSRRVLVDTTSGAEFFGKFGDYIYYMTAWSNFNKISIVEGASASRVGSESLWLRSSSYDDTSLYFVNYWNKSLYKFDSTTGEPPYTIINSDSSQQAGRSLNGPSHAYLSVEGSIKQVSKNGGTVTTILLPEPTALVLGVDETYFYYTVNANEQLWRIPIIGGDAELLDEDARVTGPIYSHNGYIYWQDFRGGSGNNALYRLATSTSNNPPETSDYTLSISVIGDGSGIVASTDGVIYCSDDCVEEYLDTSAVELYAQADPGSVFIGWDYSGCLSDNRCVVTPEADSTVSIQAIFELSDIDNDSVPDINDKCPTQSEDIDGFQDEDGCAEPGGGAKSVNEPTKDELKLIASIQTINPLPKKQKLKTYFSGFGFFDSEETLVAKSATGVLRKKADNDFARGNLCEAATWSAARIAANEDYFGRAFSTLFGGILFTAINQSLAPFTFPSKVLIGGVSKLGVGLVAEASFGVLDYNQIPEKTFKTLTSITAGYMLPYLTKKYIDQALAALALRESSQGLSDKLVNNLVNNERIVVVEGEARNIKKPGGLLPIVGAKIGLVYNEATHYVTLFVRSSGVDDQHGCGENFYVLRYEIDEHGAPVDSAELGHIPLELQ